MSVLMNSLNQSHAIIKKVVQEGDVAIDATAGNGNDTAFLAGLVGKKGKVFSFDIQQRAIEKTKEKLESLGIRERVELIHDGHQNLNNYVTGNIKAVMFNLGYLPGGDHNIGTKGNSTIEAIKKSMELLPVCGVISIVVYYGGDSGFDEKNAVLEFVRTIDCKTFSVMQLEYVNQVNCPPLLICIEKYA